MTVCSCFITLTSPRQHTRNKIKRQETKNTTRFGMCHVEFLHTVLMSTSILTLQAVDTMSCYYGYTSWQFLGVTETGVRGQIECRVKAYNSTHTHAYIRTLGAPGWFCPFCVGGMTCADGMLLGSSAGARVS